MNLGGGVVFRELGALTVADFRPLIGQDFRVTYPGVIENLTLVEAQASRTPTPAGLRPGFTLRFEGQSRERCLPQATHPIEHATFGRLDLFIVPLGPGPNGQFVYEAVFG